MRTIKLFFHHLLNPHCAECKEEHRCMNCDTLREVLATEKFEKKQLLDRILELTSPGKAEPINTVRPDMKPMGTPFVPLRVRMDMLAQSDKERHDALVAERKQVVGTPKSVEELEKELEVANG